MKTKSAKPPPSAAAICSWFTKCGPPEYQQFGDDFRSLTPDEKRQFVQDIQNGFSVRETIAYYTEGKEKPKRKRKVKNESNGS